MPKGPSYEREFCRRLGEWWCGDDDAFWRSAGSGGRATARARTGRRTQGHCGDVAACCADAEILLAVVTLELKRGYNTVTPADLLDLNDVPSPKGRRRPRFQDFCNQAAAAADRAGTPYWMVVHRRDSREAIVYMPTGLAGAIELKPTTRYLWATGVYRIIGTRLDDFFRTAEPAMFRHLYRRIKRGR